MADAIVAAATAALGGGGGGVCTTLLEGVAAGLWGREGLCELDGWESSESDDSSPGRDKTFGLNRENKYGAIIFQRKLVSST